MHILLYVIENYQSLILLQQDTQSGEIKDNLDLDF